MFVPLAVFEPATSSTLPYLTFLMTKDPERMSSFHCWAVSFAFAVSCFTLPPEVAKRTFEEQ